MDSQSTLHSPTKPSTRRLSPLKLSPNKNRAKLFDEENENKLNTIDNQAQGLSGTLFASEDRSFCNLVHGTPDEKQTKLVDNTGIKNAYIGLANTFPLITKDLYEDYDVQRPARWAWFTQNNFIERVEDNILDIICYTWNMYGRNPKHYIEEFMGPKSIQHHIIAIGSEECLRPICKSMIYSAKKEWEHAIEQFLGNEYTKLRSHTLNAIHLIIFVHTSIAPMITDIDSDDISTGICNLLGNKGGVGISFKLKNNMFLFVNCHLQSGQHAVNKRCEDFNRIESKMKLPKSFKVENPKDKLSDKFDYVFWSGDFNFRIHLSREETFKLINENKFDILLQNDQMKLQQNLNEFAKGFSEHPIKFAPTYKYDINTTIYDSSKKARIPGWTDRIMYLLIIVMMFL